LIYNDPNPVDYALVRQAQARIKVFYILALYEKELLKGLKPRRWIPLPYYQRLRFLRRSLRSPYLKLANASWIQNWLKDNLGIETQLLIGGINPETFRPVDVPKEPNKVRVLYSGDPRARKGTKCVERALELARSQDPRITATTYYGKGIPQSEMSRVYSSADIFVDGQLYAGWNNPVAEAMACEVPVVCTEIGGVADFAFPEQTALLVPPKDVHAMANAVLRLACNVPLRRTLSEHAYEHIARFDWDKTTEKLEKLLAAHLEGGEFNPSYTSARQDVLQLVPSNAYTVLDVGCSTGEVGMRLKRRGDNKTTVVGIEQDPAMAEVASTRLDQVVIGDVEKIDFYAELAQSAFDTIICADILEHLRDPWKCLSSLHPLLAEDGTIIASLPNVRHYVTLLNLIFAGNWPYRDRGIHDRTHLRFFALRNIHALFENANFRITMIKRKYRLVERPHRLNRLAHYLALPVIREFLTYQYLVVAKKRNEDLHPHS